MNADPSTDSLQDRRSVIRNLDEAKIVPHANVNVCTVEPEKDGSYEASKPSDRIASQVAHSFA